MKPAPKGWGEDPITNFLDECRLNQFATFHNMQTDSLIEVDRIFRQLCQNAINPRPWFPMNLLLRSHSAFLSAAGLAMSGQVYDAFPLIRSCLESALYAHYVSKDDLRVERWLRRHDSEDARKKVRDEFKIFLLVKEVAADAPKIAQRFQSHYDRSIDFGAHPNEKGFSLSTSLEEGNDETNIQTVYLQDDPKRISFTLDALVGAGTTSLLLGQLIYRDRCKLLGLDERIRNLATMTS